MFPTSPCSSLSLFGGVLLIKVLIDIAPSIFIPDPPPPHHHHTPIIQTKKDQHSLKMRKTVLFRGFLCTKDQKHHKLVKKWMGMCFR